MSCPTFLLFSLVVLHLLFATLPTVHSKEDHPEFPRTCKGGVCICPLRSVCVGSSCMRGHNRHLDLMTRFKVDCDTCRCEVQATFALAFSSPESCNSLATSDLSLQQWHIQHVGEHPSPVCRALGMAANVTALSASNPDVAWFAKAHSFLPPTELDTRIADFISNNPWLSLCQPAHIVQKEWKPILRQVAPSSIENVLDPRLAVWVHEKIVLRPELAATVTQLLNLNGLDVLSMNSRSTHVIYIHELHSGPIMVLQPRRFLRNICPRFPGLAASELHASSDDQVEHVLRLAPDDFAHSHYTTIELFVRAMQGKPVQQAVHSPSIMQDCLIPWASDRVTLPVASRKYPEPTLAMIIPTYPGHWPFLREAVQRQYESTVQPDIIIIASGNMDLLQARMLLTSMPNNTANTHVVVVGVPGMRYASQNRNAGVALSRMQLSATLDGDDLPHVQRNELLKVVFQHTNYSVLAHPARHHDKRKAWDTQHLECILTEPELFTHVHGHLYNMSIDPKRGILKALRGPPRPLELHGYAHHGSTCFQTVFFRTTQWVGQAVGEDQRFNRGILQTDHSLGQDTGYFAAWRMLWYFQSRSAGWDKQRNHPLQAP